MANFTEKELLTMLKSYSRSNPLPLDSSSVWDTKEEADNYAKQPNAYAGQIISVKMTDGKYKAYILQGKNGNCIIEKVGADPSEIKQYVVIGTRPESGQEQGVIYIEGTVGYIWNGSKWVKIFEDVSTSITDFQSRITKLESDIVLKANIANPNFTGVAKVEGKELATKEYADAIVAAAKSEVPIVIDEEHAFPATSYKAGQKYVVGLAGTYLGQKCEVGDVILITKDYNADSASNSDGIVLQANIDGAVTGASSSIDGEIVVFSGATGKVIKSSKINMSTLNDALAKIHEHANKDKLDTYDKTQTELLAEASKDAQSKVDALKVTVDKKADKATTLAGYGITDAYNTTDIDAKLQTINTNLNTKVDAATVDTKIETAKPEFLQEAAQASKVALEERVGAIPSETTIKEYVDTAVGTGSGDMASEIAKAKEEAIKTSKEYTDSKLAIVQF